MFRLKRLNVVQIVDSEHKANKLISQGFTLTSQPSFKKAVTTLPKPEASGLNSEGNEEKVKCPYCEKKYSNVDSLKRHVKDKHPEELENYIELIKE